MLSSAGLASLWCLVRAAFFWYAVWAWGEGWLFKGEHSAELLCVFVWQVQLLLGL